MTLIERLLATHEYTPEELDCTTFRRCDGGGRREVRAILVGLETRDEIVAALSKDEILSTLLCGP